MERSKLEDLVQSLLLEPPDGMRWTKQEVAACLDLATDMYQAAIVQAAVGLLLTKASKAGDMSRADKHMQIGLSMFGQRPAHEVFGNSSGVFD